MIKNLGARKLSKTGSHRRAMFSNMISSLLMHEKVTTTVPKAKELKRFAEKVITAAKKGNRTSVRSSLRGNRQACDKVLETIAPRYKERNGGYTRILKLGPRRGDATEMALVKLVQ
ncbi:MAG TPA: 50S ribosomal protein L17 [Elusimicrobia bacterium]|nr:50S ribosomal protein L17 [Elusimicrobiales bacterium]HBE88184.1 50S ribosomal protein L17 [Elusimicrobiota bacterium]